MQAQVSKIMRKKNSCLGATCTNEQFVLSVILSNVVGSAWQEFVKKFQAKMKEKEADLKEVLQEVEGLAKERENISTEKRSIDRKERDMLNSLKAIRSQIEENNNEKKLLEDFREQCILA